MLKKEKPPQMMHIYTRSKDPGNGDLTEPLVDLLPLWPLSLLSSLLSNQLSNVEFSDTSVQIHIVGANKRRTVYKLVRDVKQNDDRCSKVDLEEIDDDLAGSHAGISDGCESSPELCDQNETVEHQSDPRADESGLRSEGQFVQTVPLNLPGLAETNVSETDTQPCEDGTET